MKAYPVGHPDHPFSKGQQQTAQSAAGSGGSPQQPPQTHSSDDDKPAGSASTPINPLLAVVDGHSSPPTLRRADLLLDSEPEMYQQRRLQSCFPRIGGTGGGGGAAVFPDLDLFVSTSGADLVQT
jgi:hypothetical protein